ncbi:MAG: hypothetical protein HZB91_01355 [Elusimicrobia bacterium]|nr:hypothetical protein [Elusimicrobiota bacterium]
MPTPVQAPRFEEADRGGAAFSIHIGRGAVGLGILGAVLACATALAAVVFGVLAMFVTPLIAAAVTTLLWPVIFSQQFTSAVFGTPFLPFWKAFLLFVLIGAVVRFHKWSHSGELWRRK